MPTLRKLTVNPVQWTGVRFSLKTSRATFAQMAVDRGEPTEKVSRALHRKTTRTTEAFYARIRGEDAFQDFERAFETPEMHVSAGQCVPPPRLP